MSVSINVRILVTGGSGFIGTNIIDYYLKKGITVLSLDLRPPQNTQRNAVWKQTDILGLGELKKKIQAFNPTHIIHLAARTDLDENNNIQGYAANIRGQENILKALQECPALKR